MSTYVHLTPDYLRDEIDRLTFAPAAPADSPTQVQEAVAGGLVTRLLLDPVSGPAATVGGGGGHQAFPALGAERDIGFEPTTFSFGTECQGVARRSKRPQAVGTIQDRNAAPVHGFAAFPKSRKGLSPGCPPAGKSRGDKIG
jgi:hypothetical protein